jgi:hypothetical protein
MGIELDNLDVFVQIILIASICAFSILLILLIWGFQNLKRIYVIGIRTLHLKQIFMEIMILLSSVIFQISLFLFEGLLPYKNGLVLIMPLFIASIMLILSRLYYFCRNIGELLPIDCCNILHFNGTTKLILLLLPAMIFF